MTWTTYTVAFYFKAFWQPWKYFATLSPLPLFNLHNLTNVLFIVNCFLGKFDKCFNVGTNLWRSMVCGDLWWTEPTDYSHNGDILHYSRLWCTILQVLPNQSYTIAYSSLIAAMSLQLTNNHSIILVPMEETLLHKLQSTESRSRYLQIPDCYKLSNGGFDVKHFLPVFYFHVLALNCTLMQRTVIASSIYSLGYQSKPCDIFMNLLSSSLPFTFFQ